MRKTIELNHGKPGVIERDALYTIDEAADRLPIKSRNVSTLQETNYSSPVHFAFHDDG